MINMDLTLGGPSRKIVDPDSVYDAYCTPEWWKSDFANRVLTEVCHAKEINGLTYTAPFWYEPHNDVVLSYKDVGTGIKSLFCMMFMPDAGTYSLTKCGENLVPYIIEIAKHHKLTCRLGYFLPLDGINIHITNDDSIVTSKYELFSKLSAVLSKPFEMDEDTFDVIGYLEDYLDVLPFHAVVNCNCKEDADDLINLVKKV